MTTHVLIVANSLAEGGSERWASVTANGLDRSKFRASLALLRGKIEYECRSDIVVSDLEHRAVHHSWRTIRRLRRLIADTGVDIVVSSGLHTGLFVSESMARRHGSRWVARISSNFTRPQQSLPQRMATYWFGHRLARARAIVGNSEQLSGAVRNRWPGVATRVHTILNGVNSVTATPIACGDGAPNEPLIVAAGRLHGAKRPDLFVEALRRLAATIPFQALWLGDGPLRQSTQQAIDQAGLGDRVQLRGFQSNVHAIMANAACFVLCSDHEGAPNVVGEAMALGVPVVSTDCPFGPAELLGEDRGTLVPISNAKALAEAIAATLIDRVSAAARARRAQEWAREHLEGSRIIHCWESLFRRVIEADPVSEPIGGDVR